MKKKKYPDNTVYNYETDEFDASKKPYPTSLGSPNFKPVSVDKETSYKAETYFSSRFSELKKEYKKLVEEYNWTSLVYEAECNYTPLTGEPYHLYQRKDKSLFLSMIEPSQWKQEYVGTFTLHNNGTWEKNNIENV